VCWDRVIAVEPVGGRETYDLEIEGDHNFLANDLVVHNSHSSSFALLAYASAYLKAHHGPAFYAAVFNNQPMGFYHSATVVNDARRHGVRVLPVDVTHSDWLCTLEFQDDARSHDPLSQATHGSTRSQPPIRQWAVRLGLRYVKGLREAAGRALVAARAERPFVSARDLASRAQLARDEMQTLAAIGALAPLSGTRRANVWTTAETDLGPLFADAPPAGTPSPLREMNPTERLVADYAGTGVTLGPHPMALRRPELWARGVRRAHDLAAGRDGERVRVAGSVIVRQRPGTAKGFVFLSLEDETGIANVIVTPRLFARQRWELVAEPFLLAEGILQIQDGVVSVRAARVEPLWRLEHVVPSHDFG
jgi:error-prone DNA polymerase